MSEPSVVDEYDEYVKQKYEDYVNEREQRGRVMPQGYLTPVEPGVTPLIGTNGYLFKCPECEDELEGLTFDAANGYARGHARSVHRRAPF
jgi:hypothetical protein